MRLLFLPLLLCVVLIINPVVPQNIDFHIESLMSKSHQYMILRIKEKIKIDGKDNEEAWSMTPWKEMFTEL